MFTVTNPPRRTTAGKVITCKPRLVPAHYVLLAAYHVYMIANAAGEVGEVAGDDPKRWSIPTMARTCR